MTLSYRLGCHIASEHEAVLVIHDPSSEQLCLMQGRESKGRSDSTLQLQI
jgi:hypothetical protein